MELEKLRTVTVRLATARPRLQDRHPAVVKRHKIAQRLTEETTAQILAEYQAGSCTPVLAKQYNLSTTAVKSLLHLHGVPVRRLHRLSDADVLVAVELYQAGWSLARIGHRFDVDDETVRQRLKRMIVMRAAHWRPKH